MTWLFDELLVAADRLTGDVIDELLVHGVPLSIFQRPRLSIGIGYIRRVRWMSGFYLPAEKGHAAIIVADGVPGDDGWDEITELVAISPRDPTKFLLREGTTILGEHTRRPRAIVHDTPWDWLRADDGGICLV